MNQVREYAGEEFALPAIEEPITFKQAQNSDDSKHWQEAMQREINELQRQEHLEAR